MVMPARTPPPVPCSNADCFRCGRPLLWDRSRGELFCATPYCPGPAVRLPGAAPKPAA